jgi:hypothetical protein
MRRELAILTFLSLIFMISCNVICKQRNDPRVIAKINKCRDQWMYIELSDTLKIKLLMLDTKGHYDLVGWPNLFIGVDDKNDTIGLIDNFTTKAFKNNSFLTFAPYNYGSIIDKALTLQPVFKVHKKKKDNDLYCKIKKLYYCRLIE